MAEGSAPLTGRNLNGYEVLGKLGAGGMGVVYKALDNRLQRTVALKFLPDAVNADRHARELFMQEARAASALDHPNIGTIHGIEETPDGHLFIVMACYEGETLAEKISSGPIPPLEAAAIAMQIAKGLAEAHSRGIVHRDIKPSNIILTKQGLVKIVDFGLARVIHSASVTQSGSIAGTAVYMSPEQAMGKQLDHRTDLWSFGATLYTMLNRRLAFEGDSTPATLFAIAHMPPREMEPSVPPAMQRIVYRALVKDRQERYQSASEMLADLQQQAGGLALSQADPTQTARDLSRYREMASGTMMTAPPKRLFASPRARFAAVAAAALLAIGLLTPGLRQRIERIFIPPPPRHIAVLPISVIGGSTEDAALADGLMESLSSKLSNLEVGNQSLWVVPASEVRRRRIDDPAAARKAFATNLVVTGSLQRDGEAVRLVVNLIDTANLRQLGSGQFEDRGGDLSALQDSAVTKLANLMDLPLTREMLHNTGGSVMPAAYQSYLKALGDLQRYDKPGNLDAALKLLGGAVQTDPKFALAFASLAEAYVLKFKLDHDKKWLDEASANCNRALELNDQLAPVYVTMGRIHDSAGELDLALQEFQHALDLEPHNADALFGIATVYENQGRIQEAEKIYVRAAAMRPDYWDGYNKLGVFYKRQKRYDDAVRQFQRAIQLTPDNVAPYINWGSAMIEANRLDEASVALEKAIQIAPTYAIYTNLGQVYYRQQKYAQAAAATEQALKLNSKDFRVWVNLADAYAWLNRTADENAAFRQALPLVEAAAKLSPQDAGIQAQLAELYAHEGRKQDAFRLLGTALALSPDDLAMQEHAADVNEILGEHAKAVRILNEAVRKGYPLATLKQNNDLVKVLSDPQFHFQN